jgi:hypothetical protein
MPTPADTRNSRQRRVFTYVVNLYAPIEGVGAEGEALDHTYPEEPTYSNVRTFWRNMDEENTPSTVGRTNYDIILTTDEFKFAIEQEIGDGWMIEMVSGAGEENGQTYVSMGGAKQRANKFRRRAHQNTVAARRLARPPL